MEKKYDILSEEIMGKSIDNFFYKIQDKKEEQKITEQIYEIALKWYQK